MTRPAILVVAALCISALLMTACGSGSGNNGTTEAITIRVAAWNDAADALKAAVPEFNKKYPNIKVNIEYVDTGYTKIMPTLASGSNAPDIVQIQERDFPAFLKKFPGAFVDITDRIQNIKSDFIPSTWESVTKDDRVFGVPWDIGPVALYYRKDMFQAAGIDPDSINTWDDFIAAGRKLKQKFPDVAMWGYGDNDFDPFEMLFSQLGGSYVTSDGKINLHSKEAQEALAMLKKMKDAGILMNFKDWNGQITALNNNKMATVVYPVWYAGTLMHAVKDQSGKWGIRPMPAFTEGGNRAANLGGSVLAITKQSRNADAAWKFIEYCLATIEGQTVMLEYGLFPAYTPIYETDAFKKNFDYFGMPIYPFFAELAKKVPPMNHGPIMLDATKPLKDMQQAVLNGTDPAEATKTAALAISRATGLPLSN